MSTINQAYINALLADAAYVAVTPDMNVGRLTELLQDRMTPTQAAFIANNFEVISSLDTNDFFESGFDAVVWKGRQGTEYADQVFASMRGTEPGQDLFVTDADLAITGTARAQIVDMVNWWLRETADAGAPVRQIMYLFNADPIAPDFYDAPLAVGTGRIKAADLVGGIEVNGHSLGGYLASAFTHLFASQAHVTHTSTFNSAGFAPGSEAVFQELQNLMGPSYGLGRFPNSAEQSNYFGVNGLNVTTNSFYFNQQGQRVELFQEDGLGSIFGIPDPFSNHYMYKLTDLLALGAALEKLDASMTFAKLNELVKAGSNDMKGSYEGVLDGLRKVLIDRNVASVPSGDTDSATGTRKTYHEVLKQLTDLFAEPSGTLKALAGKLTLTLPTTSLATTAKTDFAAFLSLNALSPVVVSTTDAAAIAALKAANPALATSWTTGYSDNWYTDRTTLLQAITKRNQLDLTAPTPIVADASFALDRVLNIQYMEAGDTTFKTLTAWNPANDGGGNALSTRDKQLIGLGNDDANTLTGGRRNEVAINLIASSDYFISARSRFDIKPKAMNRAKWRVAA